MILLGTIAVLLLSVVVYMTFAPQLGGKIGDAVQTRLEKSPHFKKGKFVNLVPTPMPAPKLSTMLEFFKKGEGRTPVQATVTTPFEAHSYRNDQNKEDIQFSWFGHSSVLLRVEGKTVLFDPVFGERASMVSFAGPKKYDYTNDVQVEDLPVIDAVLISHDHYDHLDYPTIKKLKDRVNRFFVPLGVGVHLERWGVPKAHIVELDWWQEAPMDDFRIVLTPTRHFSGRGITNRDKTLWGAWSVMGSRTKVFFSGDSGYFDGFKEVGEKYGPYDLAFIECGQYNEEWAHIHMMPEESAQVGEDLNARQVVPIHWGKFTLSLHDWTEPIERFLAAARSKNYRVITPVPGDVVAVSQTSGRSWWKTPELVEVAQSEQGILVK